MATKKVGPTGRFGARYGATIRRRVLEVEKRQRAPQRCPYCRKFRAKRIAVGIFLCKSCDAKFTGKAYTVA